MARAVVVGTVVDNVLEFEVSLPVAEIFAGPVPESFLFDARALGLREGKEPYFSGPDPYSIERPFVWGDVVLHRP